MALGVGRRWLLQDSDGVEGMVIAIAPSQGQLSADLDILWLLLGAYLVFFMQVGLVTAQIGPVCFGGPTFAFLLRTGARLRSLCWTHQATYSLTFIVSYFAFIVGARRSDGLGSIINQIFGAVQK